MLRALLITVVLGFMPLAAHAQATARIDPVYRALKMPEVIAIMRDEGLDYGKELALEVFGEPGGNAWARVVDGIYDQALLEEVVRRSLAEDLDGTNIEAMVTFFDSELGQRIIGLEIGARRALLDPDIETESRANLADMRYDSDPRLDLIEEFSEVNALIENNVVGALNSNFAFYQGLSEGGAFEQTFSEEEMLADVWSQEDAIRVETEDWLYSYLAMAYDPLSDEELRNYIAFSRTKPGEALNQAVFNAFDDMFVAVSLALGSAAADFMASQEL
ncbi:DUF2059 domain-containing protein [Pseudoruegeria sp. HB172150]|uniref:DUF2059 domain-containing protein n=1 Tax=Pseudoruegeria sp. HB172150 TaxID=2721164 RepID=UPI0015562B8D|nr:DUF2059 domain-containing protein [Pseudoruegeria sp. HB172150]